MTHRIRLRGPWEVETERDSQRVPIPFSIRNNGPVTFHRHFGRPTNLDAHKQVWLAFDAILGSAVVRLNGKPIGTANGHAEFDVTARLTERNELVVQFESSDQETGIAGDVVLEIRTIPPPIVPTSQSYR